MIIKYAFDIDSFWYHCLCKKSKWFPTLKEAFDDFHRYFEYNKQEGDKFEYYPYLTQDPFEFIKQYEGDPDVHSIPLGFINLPRKSYPIIGPVTIYFHIVNEIENET